ncbi:MAG: macro domain-containing protein [Candidatus Obscuribacterales bacterium]|nr:macro domain-containing protein [Candidatus Obscuribacterales bacterium]
MIEVTFGNLLERDAEALINTVNCVGVMGKGIALQFKRAYPENFKAYELACKHKEVQIGKMFVYSTGSFVNPRFIINFPTKDHWRSPSKIEYIEKGLDDLVQWLEEHKIHSVAMPPLGCGNGGLEWMEVYQLVVKAFEKNPEIKVYLFSPLGAPAADKMPVNTKRPNMSVGRAAVLTLANRYQLMDISEEITQIVLQKLSYFLQSSGFDLRLNFQKGTYGPYAENLNHVLQVMEGHFIRGYGDRSSIDGSIEILPDCINEATAVLNSTSGLAEHTARVLELIEGFNSEYLLELLSTVHWIAHHDPEGAADYAKIAPQVKEWSVRKSKLFGSDDIKVAWERLVEKGWITPPEIDAISM